MAAFRPRRILEVLDKHGVDFVLIGGVANSLHGSPYPTVDLDVVPALETSNLDRLVLALSELDAVLRDADTPEGIRLDLDGKTLKRVLPDFGFLRFDTKFGFLDLLYRPAGTKGYRDLNRGASDEVLGSIRVRVAALEDIIRSKEAVGRPRDREQLPTLRRLLEVKRKEDDSQPDL